MKRKPYPKFIAIKRNIINVSTIRRIGISSSGYYNNKYIDVVYFDGCDLKTLSICFDSTEERDKAFDKITEDLL